MLQVRISCTFLATYSRLGSSKPLNLRLLLRISANHADAGKIFLHFGGKRGQRRLNLFVQFVDDFAEIPDRDGHHRNGQEHPQSQRLAK